VGVTQLVLPPDYPADPRILAGVDPHSGSSPYVAAAFGTPFQPISALPSGQVAVSARFDSGDARLFVGALTGVWSLNIASSAAPAVAHLEVEYTSMAAGSVAALATPPTSPDAPAVLAWVPALAAVPGALGAPHASATVMACPIAAPCAPLGDLPVPPWRLIAGAEAPRAVVAFTATQAFVSLDGGQSFERLGLPAGTTTLSSFAVVGREGEVWVNLSEGPTTFRVFRRGAAGVWVDATRGDGLLQTHLGALVAIGPRRILDAMSDAGYRCTARDAAVWTPRCPLG
jgi:hypothetical protein